jgi:uncharacterized membrane protein YiaA
MCRAFEVLFVVGSAMGLANISFDIGNDVFFGIAFAFALVGMVGTAATYTGTEK